MESLLIAYNLTLTLLMGTAEPSVVMQQKCLIENVVYESHWKDIEDQRAVVEVTLNRLAVNYRGATNLCEVVYSPEQFSWTINPNPRQYTEQEYINAAQVAYSYLYTDMPNVLPKGTLHYMNPAKSTDKSWYEKDKVVLVTELGHHYLKF